MQEIVIGKNHMIVDFCEYLDIFVIIKDFALAVTDSPYIKINCFGHIFNTE